MRQYYPLMPANGDQGPPDRRAGPTRAARLQGLPLTPRPAEPAAGSRPRHAPRATQGQGPAGPARREEPRRRRRSARSARRGGASSTGWGSRRLPGSRSASSPSRSRPRSRRGSWRTWATRSAATRSCSAFPQTILVLGTDVRPSGLAATGRGHTAEVHRGRRPGRDAALQLQPLPRRHDHARARGPVRLSQALDPARHLRRDPGPGRPEDQRRLCLWRRQARGPDRGAVPWHRRRPGRRGRLQRLSRLHRRDRRRDRGDRPEGLLGDLGWS